MISIFRKRNNKVSDFESVVERLDCLLKAQANMKQDLRQIVREEIKNVLNERNRKGWWQVCMNFKKPTID